MRFLPIVFWVLAIIMFGAELIKPGSGWFVGGIVFLVLGIIIVLINRSRTGKTFTEENGGH